MKILDIIHRKTIICIDTEKITLSPTHLCCRRDDAQIDALAQSIRQNGILQPLCVRRTQDGYQLISGQRRLRAARSIPLESVPCVVVDADDLNAEVMYLSENLMREGLDCFDEARAVNNLMCRYSLDIAQAASLLCIHESALQHKLRLIKLSDDQIRKIRNCSLSLRHARALLAVPDEEKRDELLDRMIAEDMTAPQAEKLVRNYLSPPTPQRRIVRNFAALGDTRMLSNTVERAVMTMRRSGVDAKCSKNEDDTSVQYCITVQKPGKISYREKRSVPCDD